MLEGLLNKIQLHKDMLLKFFRRNMKRYWFHLGRWRRGLLWQSQCWRQPCNTSLANLNRYLLLDPLKCLLLKRQIQTPHNKRNRRGRPVFLVDHLDLAGETATRLGNLTMQMMASPPMKFRPPQVVSSRSWCMVLVQQIMGIK